MIEIKPNTEAAYKLLHEGALALAKAEQQGMRIDLDYCTKKEAHLTRKIKHAEQKFKNTKLYKHWNHSTSGKADLNSNYQLAYYLYDIKKIPPAKTTATGKGATDEKALAQLDIPELNELLKVRKLKKIRDTYLKAFVREQVDGYIHPSFNLHTVRTFRSSSDKPNFQNIPKRDKEAMQICRKAIYPRPGNQLLEIDFGSLEVRIAACYHQDPTMLTYIKDPTTDMHGDMAKQILLLDDFDKKISEYNYLRAAVKNGFVFPQFYGDYYKNNALSIGNEWCGLPEKRWQRNQGVFLPNGITIADHLISKGIKSMDDFINHIRKIENHFWKERFPVYAQWKEDWWAEYQRKGEINMHTGFTCKGIMGKNDCINYPIQGTAFHCLLWCFIRLTKMIEHKKWKSRFVGQVHDDIVGDIYPPELNELSYNAKLILTGDLPQHWTWINVPLKVEADLGGVDESWADLKPFELPKMVGY